MGRRRVRGQWLRGHFQDHGGGEFLAGGAGLCTRQQVDTCEVVSCPKHKHDPLADPGRLHIGPLYYGGEYEWDPGAYPLSFTIDEIAWAAGDSLYVKAEGDDTPSFELQGVCPRTLDAGFDGPVFNQSLHRNQPLAVTWVPQAEPVLIRLDQVYNDGGDVRIDCTSAGNVGAFSVPTAALASLIASEGWADTDVRAWSMNESTLVAGDYELRLRVLRGYSDQTKDYEVF